MPSLPHSQHVAIAPADAPGDHAVLRGPTHVSPGLRAVKRQRTTLWRRALREFTGVGLLSTRYSVAKFREYDAFRASTRAWRRAAVVALTPVPSLLIAMLPPLVPLQDPALGVWNNTGYMAHFFVTLSIVYFGSVFQMRAPARIPLRELSHGETLLISLLGALLLLGIVTTAGALWRFPVPFIWATAYAPYLVCFVLAHKIVLRRKVGRGSVVRASLVAFLPSYIVQGSQVIVYPAFSAVFERATAREQLALTLFFPVIKHVFRRVVHLITSQFPDDAEQESVSGIEICSIMYQSIIMQSTLSPVTTALLMSTDVALGLVSVYILMKTESLLPLHEILPRARAMLCGDERILDERELAAFSTVRRLPRLQSIVPFSERIVSSRLFRHRSAVTVDPSSRHPPLRKQSTKSKQGPLSSSDKKTITHALEILQSVETIVLIEYIEVFIPLVNALYALWASSLATAVYNPKLRGYHDDSTSLSSAMVSLVLYAVLQALSLVLLQTAMWFRYRVSAMTLLAFVLERHAWSLHGKLVTWLTLIFQFPVVHYGVDFRFEFDFRVGNTTTTASP